LEVSSERFWQKAAECDRIAERAHFARIAAWYRDLARRWRDMAQHAERLEKTAAAQNTAGTVDRVTH